MVMLKDRNLILKRVFLYSFVFSFLVLAAVLAVKTSARSYTCMVGDANYEACMNAKDEMNGYKAVATANANESKTVAEEINRIGQEINQINAEIAANEAKIVETNQKIAENEKKLNDHQVALAEMLIDMHFTPGTEPISLLAGSESISDYVEKQAREDAAQEEVIEISKEIKKLKEELEKEKQEAERRIQANQSAREEANQKRAKQNELKAEYDKNANDATVLASYWEDILEDLAWKPAVTVGAGGKWAGRGNTYPYQNNCPRDNNRYTAYNGNVCQCTSYASWKAYEKWGVTAKMGGHARSYVNAEVHVPTTGITTYVDNVPAPYTIAVQTGGAYGHVMWVESVNSNGTINVTEYNVSWASIGCYAGDFCSRQGVGTANTWFIHFE
ncbi:MAG: CHAP domain-containing protein [Candidatus Saccharibacteria bacterium]|nr:CHAP domain-containing protein [Candidatus Saccharibacteria bacterium]